MRLKTYVRMLLVFTSVMLLIVVWESHLRTLRWMKIWPGNDNGLSIIEHVNAPVQDRADKYSSGHNERRLNSTDVYPVNLVDHPEDANQLSALLTTRQDVINEAQRIHMNIFKTLLGRYKFAMLFHYVDSENKGDSAIGVGEFILLHKLNIKIVFGCTWGCTKEELIKAEATSKDYNNEELVILLHGGGNVIGWPAADHWRSSVIPRFQEFHIVMFPQSILYIGPQSHIDFCKTTYASHKHLTFLWRDTNSYKLGKSLFPNVTSLMSPDMAYQIGYVPRFMLPTHDVLWLKRTDKETPSYQIPKLPVHLSVHVSDWLNWKSQKGQSPIEAIHLMTTNGMVFLQRGRVVITDRLHGHILCTLLGIPHVYIDNKQKKISNYHNTWTASVENIVLANSSSDALIQAEKLLTKLDQHLPVINRFYSD